MSDLPRVVIADFIQDSLEPELAVLEGCARVEQLDAHCEEDLVGRIEDAAAVMQYHCLALTRKTIERLENCRLIVRCGVGYDNVDHQFARSRGIPVANVPDYGTEEVADSAIGLMLSLTRGIAVLNSRLRAGDGPWSYTLNAPVRRLRGSTFAVVGLGRIGTAAALRAKAIGMQVVFYDPYAVDGSDKALGIRRVETLEDLLRQAHVLSLHCPLSDQTRYMIDAAAIEQMPRGSFLVNTARGDVVDTSAIPAALASGRLAGAGLDVLPQEPPSDDDPLLLAWRDPGHPAHHRLIINPHTAFYSEEGLREMRTKGAQACLRALEGLPLRNVVN
jgi:D-3-phosphoglycerate dehydrogenase/C-terminal binding protein